MARTYTWAAGSGSFASPGNWDDITSGTAEPTNSVPSVPDIAILGVAGVEIVGGPAVLVGIIEVTAATTLAGPIAFGNLLVGASLSVASGATVDWIEGLGGGTAAVTAAVTVNGTLSLAAAAARLTVTSGTSDLGTLAVAAGGDLAIGGGAAAMVDTLAVVGAGAAATLSVAGAASLGASPALTGNWLAVGDGGAASATLTAGALVTEQVVTVGFFNFGSVGDGTLLVQDSATLDDSGLLDVADASGDVGRVTLDGAGASITSAGLVVGNGGAGTLSIAAGAALLTAVEAGSTGAFAGALGNLAGGYGRAVISGAGSTWTIAGAYDFGPGGHALVSILSGGAVRSTATAQPVVSDGRTSYAPNLTLGTARVVVRGVGSVLNTGTGAFWIGDAGFSALTIAHGASVSALGPAQGVATVILGLNGGSGSLVVLGSGAVLSAIGLIDVGGTNQGAGQLTIGTHATLNAGNGGDALDGMSIADAPGSTGAVSVAGAGAVLNDLGQLQIGGAGAGLLSVGAGGSVAANIIGGGDGAPTVVAGATAGATGTIVVAGANAVLSTSQTMLVGMYASATMTVSDNGQVDVTGTLGLASRDGYTEGGAASALVTVDNATLDVTGELWLGERSGNATLPGYLGTSTLAATDGAVIGVYNDTTLEAGSQLIVSGATMEIGGLGTGLAAGVWVDAGFSLIGDGQVLADVSNRGTVAADGGSLRLTAVSGGNLGIWTGNATLDIGTLDGGTIDFLADGTFVLHGAPSAPVALSVGPDGGTIDVAGTVVTAASATAGALVMDAAGGAPISLTLATPLPAGPLRLTSDGAGGTDVVIPCFAAGTRIRTARGEVPVETLRPGDRVLTASGRLRPVVWVGTRTLDCRRHARPWDVHPVHLCPGALADGVPARPLRLSPDHAVFVAGGLVPVRYLLNGVTITQAPACLITYVHVELDEHDLLLAEGTPAESYLDTGNRAAFAAEGETVMLHPDFARTIWAARGYAPLITSGQALLRARGAVLAQASRLGHRRTRHPALRLFADGTALRPAIAAAEWSVTLPARAHSLVLASRVGVPAHTLASAHDTRPLGVAITALALDGQAIAMDHPAFAAGWHAAETGWRWSNGAGALRVAGIRRVTFRLAITGRYWTAASMARADAPATHQASDVG